MDIHEQAQRTVLVKKALSRISISALGLISITCIAHAESCQEQPTAEITVAIIKGDAREQFDVTTEDLKRAAASMGAQPHQPALAAYSAELAYAADISENTQPEEGGVYCASLTSVHVTVALKNPVIHFARELKDNRCLEEVQRGHWREHVRADAEAIDKFPFLSELRDAVAHSQTARGNSAFAAKTRLTAAIHSDIERLMDQLDGYRTSVKQTVDRPEAIEELRVQMKNCSTREHAIFKR